MTKIESQAINIARFIFMIGVLFIHFTISVSPADGINLSIDEVPIYLAISGPNFLSACCLPGLFLLSGYLFFNSLGGVLNYDKKINSRIRSLVVPYLFWNVFWLAYNILKTRYMSAGSNEFLQIDSIGDFFACFWERGYGAHATFPIAGYMWFIRDLFIFAVLSPAYYYCYKNRWLSYVMMGALAICQLVEGWHIPGFNFWIYLGGFLAYKDLSMEDMCKKISWLALLPVFIITNVLYYILDNNLFVAFILAFVSIILVLKVAMCLYKNNALLALAPSSTWIYVTHIFVLNVSRHYLAKVLTIDSDLMMCVYYVLNASLCVAICLSTYYLLKKFKCTKILAITTGGRG